MFKGKFKNLAAEMQRMGITQVKLAEELGLSKLQIHYRLYGVTEWKMEEIWKILEIFNNDFEYLFK